MVSAPLGTVVCPGDSSVVRADRELRTAARSDRSQGDRFSGQCGDCRVFESGVVACKTPRTRASGLIRHDIRRPPRVSFPADALGVARYGGGLSPRLSWPVSRESIACTHIVESRGKPYAWTSARDGAQVFTQQL